MIKIHRSKSSVNITGTREALYLAMSPISSQSYKSPVRTAGPREMLSLIHQSCWIAHPYLEGKVFWFIKLISLPLPISVTLYLYLERSTNRIESTFSFLPPCLGILIYPQMVTLCSVFKAFKLTLGDLNVLTDALYLTEYILLE